MSKTISYDIENNSNEEDYSDNEEQIIEEVVETDVKVPKKRGRKPKVKDETVKVLKKRGRKPKEKIYTIKDVNKAYFDDNKNETLILHLPIKKADVNNEEPKPMINDNLHFFDFDDNEKNELNEINNNADNIKINLININDKEEDKNTKLEHHKVNNVLYEFISSNIDKEWPVKTSTYCWWCCHPFDNTPCALPENYVKNKFYVYGCFCSFNCATSYNFSINDNEMWERYSLLNLLYSKIYNTKFIKINMSPPRETLRIFGGYMSIEEFRENSIKNDKNYRVVKPPLISIIPKIEETNYNINRNKITYIPLNKELVEKAENTMKLKREKPIVNPNYTLQTFMDLKKI